MTSRLPGPGKQERLVHSLTSDENLINCCFLWLFMHYYMHINEHIPLAVQITFYRYETCISFHRLLTWLKRKVFWMLLEFVFVSTDLTPEGPPKIPGVYPCRLNQLQLRVKRLTSKAAKPRPIQPAKTSHSAIAGHEMTELRLRSRDGVP